MKLQVAGSLIYIFASIVCAAPPQSSVAQSTDVAVGRSPVQVGEMAPDFTLEDQHGRKVKLSAARGKMLTVLVFYRGYW